MNVEDLEWQTDSYGGVNPQVVDSLLERGHLELVVQAASEREDWFCASGAVRDLRAAGEFERAWEVIRPFAETGWLPAVTVGAAILLQRGRVEEALVLARPDGEGREQGEACKVYAEVLVQAGQVDTAIDTLVPHLRDDRLLSSLVEMTEGQGQDERVLDLVTSLAEEARRMHAEGRRESLGPSGECPGEIRPGARSHRGPRRGRGGTPVQMQRSCVRPTRDFSRGTDASRSCVRWPLAIMSMRPSSRW
ncbi:hypothetical protein ABXI76_00405 [Streptomyces parvus]